MEHLHDLTWMQHLMYGTKIETFSWHRYRVVSLSVPPTDKRHLSQYPFRMLFFDGGANRPCLAVNCEQTILESFCLTLQTAGSHQVFMRLEGPIPYDRFRTLALERAASALPGSEGKPRARRKGGTKPRPRNAGSAMPNRGSPSSPET
jgi:hypothetical protein